MKSPPLANRSGYDDGRTAVRARRCDRKDRGLRRLMSRTKEGRDALRSSEAHPQARSIAPPWPERSQGRVPIGRHRPKSAETGETHPLPGAILRPVRRRGAALLRWQPPLTHIVLALRQGSSTKSTYTGHCGPSGKYVPLVSIRACQCLSTTAQLSIERAAILRMPASGASALPKGASDHRMADYQALLTRAVANLPSTSTVAMRHAIYERARKAQLAQLGTLGPPLPESDIAREEEALDQAI